MASLIEVGQLATTEEHSDRDGVYVYPFAMLITFLSAEELQKALQARKVEFGVFGNHVSIAPPEAI